MENQETNQNLNTTPPLVQPTAKPASPSFLKSKGLIVGVLIIFMAILLGGGFILGKNLNSTVPKACTQEAKICPDGTSVGRTGSNCEFAKCPISDQTGNPNLTPGEPKNEAVIPTKIPQINGAELENIKYALPSGWTAKLRDGGLDINPGSGGYLFIKVYNYDEVTGRREFFCKTTSYCLNSSYFTPTNIGNLSGYIANGLDNSGGGVEYFGAKGNKFYIISTYNPPSPNEYEKKYQSVLNSLVF